MPPWARGECCRTLEIEAAVCLIVSDVRAGARQYSLAGCYGFEGCSRFRNMGRNAVDLLCIEDCVDLVDEPTLRLFCRFGGRLARFDLLIGCTLHLPELNPGA